MAGQILAYFGEPSCWEIGGVGALLIGAAVFIVSRAYAWYGLPEGLTTKAPMSHVRTVHQQDEERRRRADLVVAVSMGRRR